MSYETIRTLFRAIEEGDVDALRQCIEEHPDLIREKYRGSAPVLFLASEADQAHIAQVLLQLGADVNAKDDRGFTPLHSACAKNRDNVASILVDNGADLGEADSEGLLPIHQCAKAGSMETMKVLLGRGADVRSETTNGMQAIHLACEHGQAHIVQFLLEQEVNVMSPDRYRWTPLHFAANKGHLEVARCLVEAGATADTLDEYGESPLKLAGKGKHLAVEDFLRCPDAPKASTEVADDESVPESQETECKSFTDQTAIKSFQESLRSSCREGDYPRVVSILERGLEGAELSQHVCTSLSLHEASMSGRDDIVTLLLENQSDLNYGDRQERTPLHLASEYGYNTTVAKLIARGADANSKDRDGYSPLHCACQNGHVTVVKTLLENGASDKARDNYGFTPGDVAKMKKQEDIVYLLSGSSKKTIERTISAPETSSRTPEQTSRERGCESSTQPGKDTFRRQLKKVRGSLQLISIWCDELTGQQFERGEGPVEEDHQQKLRSHYFTLAQKMVPDEVVSRLYSEFVLDKREKDRITHNQLIIQQQNEKLVDYIYGRTRADFEKFIWALDETNQRHLANLLR